MRKYPVARIGEASSWLLVAIVLTSALSAYGNFWSRCPKKCTCRSSWIRGVTTVSVDCSSKNLLTIPTVLNGLPRDVTRLILYKNYLQEIPPNAFKGLRYLKELYLYENFIAKIDRTAFSGLRRLKTLSLHHNKITKLENGTFSDLRSLESLHLFSNFLEEVNPLTFSGLQRLKTLSLHENHLRFLPLGSFKPMKQLRFLSLHRNHLTKISPGVFCLSNRLVQLYINQNKITTIMDDSFKLCRSMVKLTIGYNRLMNVTRSTFAGLDNLEELFLNNNHLEHLQQGSFLGLSRLRRLSLKGNRLNEFQNGVFSGMDSLVQLSLSKNYIVELQTNMFLGLQNLLKLSLEENKISSMRPNAFHGLIHVKNLYLYRNRISNIPAHSFTGLESLTDLNLGVNRITSVENDAFYGLARLQNLALNSNRLSSIPAGAFNGLGSLLKLSLYFNEISYVAEGAFYPLKSLIVLSWNPLPALIRLNPRLRLVRSNNLYCDCNAQWLRQWLRSNVSLASTKITCAGPGHMRKKHLQKIAKEEIKCDEIKVEISPGKAVSLVGNAIEFQCSVKPGATYNWVHNGKKVNGDKRQSKYVTTTRGYLKINNISLEDQGQVTCLAQNKAGLSAASGNLVIGSFPRIVNYPNEVVTVERPQKSLVLPCKADGIPRPKITWLKDGVQIASDHERLFSSDGSLIILRMRMHYQGIYTCFASNQLGKVSVRTRVYLGQASMCLPSCRRDSGFCVVKHVCECLPEFQGPACELRRNTVAVEHKPIVNNTVNGKPALAPDPTSWVYETYNIDINQGSGSHGVTDGDDSDASDGDMIVDVERSGVGTNVYKPDKNEETKKADRIVIKQKGAAHVKRSIEISPAIPCRRANYKKEN